MFPWHLRILACTAGPELRGPQKNALCVMYAALSTMAALLVDAPNLTTIVAANLDIVTNSDRVVGG